ncbi:hypothetical protein PMAYCL1PPCAC_26414, partial [Pristionchus mayeri]
SRRMLAYAESEELDEIKWERAHVKISEEEGIMNDITLHIHDEDHPECGEYHCYHCSISPEKSEYVQIYIGCVHDYERPLERQSPTWGRHADQWA